MHVVNLLNHYYLRSSAFYMLDTADGHILIINFRSTLRRHSRTLGETKSFR